MCAAAAGGGDKRFGDKDDEQDEIAALLAGAGLRERMDLPKKKSSVPCVVAALCSMIRTEGCWS